MPPVSVTPVFIRPACGHVDNVTLLYLIRTYVAPEAKAASLFCLLRSALPFLFFLAGCPPAVSLAARPGWWGADELLPLTAALLGM